MGGRDLRAGRGVGDSAVMDWQAILVAAIAGGVITKLIDVFAGQGRNRVDISALQNAEWQKLYEQQSKETAQAQSDVAALRTTVDHEHARAAVREDELYTQLAELRAELSGLQSVHAENMTLKDENATLKSQVRQLTIEVKELRAENEDLRAQLAALTRRLSVLEKKGTAPLGNAEPTQSQ